MTVSGSRFGTSRPVRDCSRRFLPARARTVTSHLGITRRAPEGNDAAQHESSSWRVPVGAADWVLDRNPVPAHHRPDLISKGSAASSPGLRKLTGDDAKKAEELDKAIEVGAESRSMG